jgi:Ca2+-binding EF-hand superfamily protein
MIGDFDVSDSGQISYDEFLKMMQAKTIAK